MSRYDLVNTVTRIQNGRSRTRGSIPDREKVFFQIPFSVGLGGVAHSLLFSRYRISTRINRAVGA